MNIPRPFSKSSSSSSSFSSNSMSVSSSCFSSSSSSDFTISPRSVYTEDVIGADGTLAINFLSYPKYYEASSGALLETDTTILPSGESNWDWEVTKGIWTVHIKRDGTYESKFKGASLRRRLAGIGFFDNISKSYIPKIDIDVSSWDVIFSANTVQWSNSTNDIIYTIRYQHDRAIAIVVIPQAIKKWLIANAPAKDFDEKGEPAIPERYSLCVHYTSDIRFLADKDTADKMEYIIDEAPVPVVVLPSKGLSKGKGPSKSKGPGKGKPKKAKRHKITIGSPWVMHDALYNDTISADKSLKWRKRYVHKAAAGQYLELCSPSALFSPKGALVFNDTDAFQQGFNGFTGCDDTTIPSEPISSYLYVERDWVVVDYFDVRNPLIKFDLTGELPAANIRITEGRIYLRCHTIGAEFGSSVNIKIHGMWKDWNPNNVNGVEFDTVNNLHWHGAIASEKSNATYFNNFNGYGYDTTEDSNTQAFTAGQYSEFVVPLWHIQRQYEQDEWRGWYIATDVVGSIQGTVSFYSSEFVTVPYRPVLQVTYELISSSSSFSSCSSSFSSSSFSSSSFSSSSSSGHYDVKFGEYTELRNVRFEVDNPTGVAINKRSVVYNCYARNFSSTSGYHAWNLAQYFSQTSFLMCEGVSDNGYAFYMDRNSYYCEVLISGCIAHDSDVGIRSDRYTYITNNLIWDCTYAIQVAGSSNSSAGCNCYIIGNTIYGVDYGIYPLGAAYVGGGMYIINNIIDTCAIAGFYSIGATHHSYFDYNNWHNNTADIHFNYADKGPNATALDPAFFDPGANDFRIGQHMRNLGFRTNFGSNTSYVANASVSYPNQGAIQRRETIGNDAPLWETAGQAHTGTGYVRMYPSRGLNYPQEWEFMTPCYANQKGAITFWSKGSFSGLFRITVIGDGVNINQPVTVASGYVETTVLNVNPSNTGYLTVTFIADGIGSIYIDDFAYSQSSSSSFSSSSFSSSSFSSSSFSSSSFSSSSSSA